MTAIRPSTVSHALTLTSFYLKSGGDASERGLLDPRAAVKNASRRGLHKVLKEYLKVKGTYGSPGKPFRSTKSKKALKYTQENFCSDQGSQ